MISPKSLKRLHRRRGSALPTLNLAVLVLLEDTTVLALLRKRSHSNRLLIPRCSLCWTVPRVNDRFLGPVGYVYILFVHWLCSVYIVWRSGYPQRSCLGKCRRLVFLFFGYYPFSYIFY